MILESIQIALEHHKAERLPEAEAIYRKILQIDPAQPDVLHYLGLLECQRGSNKIAIELICKAIAINPSIPKYHSNLGNAYQAHGMLDAAVSCYQQALLLKSDFADAYYNLGVALTEQHKLSEAITAFQQALKIAPGLVEAYINLGIALLHQGKKDEAVASYQRALAIRPDFVEAYINLGTVFLDQGMLCSAIENYQKALSIRPDIAEAYNSMGIALRGQGKIGAAIECHRKALAIKPDYIKAYSKLLYLHAFARDIPPDQECNLAANWEKAALPGSERDVARSRFRDSSSYPSRAGRKLRLGVVSAELGQHAVAEFLEPFLEQLDRSRFHLNLYSTSIRPEARAERFRKLADEYRTIANVSDTTAAEQIRSDRIDILIDTTGHMRGCRLGIFAHRAAPVQCHYIGYHGTTGLTEMDWFIADEELLPPSCNMHFCEGIWRLPRLWVSYKGDISLPNSDWQPSPDGVVWLGTFNNLAKVSQETIELWGSVMKSLPESMLLLKDGKAGDIAVQERITHKSEI